MPRIRTSVSISDIASNPQGVCKGRAARFQRTESETPHAKRLLLKRRETAYALNISNAQVRRLENEGLLDVIKLRGRSGSLVHHRVIQVEALANGER